MSVWGPRAVIKRFLTVALFTISLAYIEAAVVVYLRAILYPQGFTFPIPDFRADARWTPLLLTEIGREAATLVIIFAGALLFGYNRRQRVAYWLTIFAVWDIFYYIWLKILLGWPVSIMDWDVLFLIPMAWASPVLAPVIVSLTMLGFAMVILFRDHCGKPLRMTGLLAGGFVLASVIIVASFCIAGRGISKPDYQSYFWWPLFLAGEVPAVILFLRCCRPYKEKSAGCL